MYTIQRNLHIVYMSKDNVSAYYEAVNNTVEIVTTKIFGGKMMKKQDPKWGAYKRM